MNLRPGSSLNDIPGFTQNALRRGLLWACCIMLFIFVWMTDAIPLIRSHFFVATPCVAQEALLSTKISRGASKKLNVFLSFQANGKEYNAWAYDLNSELSSDPNVAQQWYNKIEEGDHLTCWYDPLYPDLVVLIKPDITKLVFFLGVPLIIMALALGTVYFKMGKKTDN